MKNHLLKKTVNVIPIFICILLISICLRICTHSNDHEEIKSSQKYASVDGDIIDPANIKIGDQVSIKANTPLFMEEKEIVSYLKSGNAPKHVEVRSNQHDTVYVKDVKDVKDK